jgi:hypothetical protein
MLERMLAMLPLGWRPQWNSMLVRNINGSQYEIFSMLFLILGFGQFSGQTGINSLHQRFIVVIRNIIYEY